MRAARDRSHLIETQESPEERTRGMTAIHPFDPLIDLIAERVAPKLAAFQQREGKRLFSLKEAATYVSLSTAQVYRLVVSGNSNHSRKAGGG